MNITSRSLFGVILIFSVLYFAVQIKNVSQERQELVLDNAEIHHVKYGLLNVHAWKNHISDILAKRVKEFEITSENKEDLREKIQTAMYQLLKEVEQILADKRKEGGWVKRTLTRVVQSLVIDVKDLESKVPVFTDLILEELNNYETREKLRVFIQDKIDKLLIETVGENDLSEIKSISTKYNCGDIERCGNMIEVKLRYIDKNLQTQSYYMLGLVFLAFIILLFKNKQKAIIEYTILIILCGILLYTGVSSPMIDIDARIDTFNFGLLGETLTFENQILFFQSKSISEVVNILISTKGIESIAVGILIFLFSILLPISKLISSIILLRNHQLYHNRFIRFIALKSSKWSMADVMVVAIFMAYIGFKGVLGSQLSNLEKMSEKVEILTTDNSTFGVGFILFLGYCIGGLVLAYFVDKKVSKTIEGS